MIVSEIFRRYFYPLFFNWSYNIRDVFIALFLYQIEYCYIQKITLQLKQSSGGSTHGIADSIMAFNKIRKSGTIREQLKMQRKESLNQLDQSLQIYEQ